ncbi:Voltage-dependent calcium channel subunit alpha-2/delta-3 [Hypsibius exemplaris]|uniref:Voltage-dependent calcium channel subunit alpha-2/delta-3 n=1 Tax=Hypsibius exemplaris TaxID=2072580 RepID=A0A1W0WWP6_HYPEX|nr:Voltage-dependent calcium channel subunit alpha-2/delta-3 [Hypsibius exemplaris]
MGDYHIYGHRRMGGGGGWDSCYCFILMTMAMLLLPGLIVGDFGTAGGGGGEGLGGGSHHFSENSLVALAEKLGSRLHHITKLASGYDEILKGFSSLNVKVNEIDPVEELKNIGSKLTQMVKTKVVAVERLVDFAEESARSHKWLPHINISYYNAKEPDGGNQQSGFERIDFHKDPRFHNDAVNFQASTVHVPTNIYSRSVSVLNGVAWSGKLDQLFRYNFKEDASLLKSQYFCSTDGFQRLYPGVKWQFSRDPEKPDMYDCRMSNWFIRASSSPKDMVILLDISGSMTGLRRDTARKTVIEIMSTLNEDDFFNVITFKNNATFLDPCLNESLVQASEMHRKRFTQLLLNQVTQDFANYTVALPLAFELLAQNYTNRTSNCNKAIMIVTDNAPLAFEDICQLYNADRHVRVFGYIVGREVTEYDGMTELACNNRGFVSHIKTMADVRDYVEEYYQVMGRPMAHFGNHTNTWTPAYWHPRNVIGMVVTAAQPVFNRSADAGSKGSLIGVAGIDIPTEDFVRLMTPHKWGVGSYVFGVNHNGHVIFHPHWKLTVTDEHPVPIQNEVDLSELEMEVDTPLVYSPPHELRNKMIDQLSGSHRMTILRLIEGQTRVYEKEYQYYITGVAGSPFSVGVAIPVGLELPPPTKPKVTHGTRRPRQADAQVFHSTDWGIHPNWFYCNATAAKFPNVTVFLEDLLVKSGLPADALDLSCDKELLESLLFDAKATQSVGDYWFADKKEHSDLYSLHGITMCFASTRAGLTRWEESDGSGLTRNVRSANGASYSADMAYSDDYINASAPISSNMPIATKHYFEIHSQAVDEAWYERTVNAGPDVTISVVLPSTAAEPTNITTEMFMASLAVFAGQAVPVPVAVAGIFMRTSALMDLIRQISQETCKDPKTCISCHSPVVTCYLLDENGYVVVDTQFAENAGKFFGVIQSEVMETLLDWRIYKKYELIDMQGMCPSVRPQKKAHPHPIPTGAGSYLRSFIHTIFAALKLLFDSLLRFVVLVSGFAFAAEEYYNYEGKEVNGTFEEKMLPPPYKCDAEYTLFHSVWKDRKLVAEVGCRFNCTKNVGVFKVPTTNLLLVALDSPRSCLCNDARVTTEPSEAHYDEEEVCAKYSAFPYRRKPTDCFSYYKEEDYSECGRPWSPSSAPTSGVDALHRLSALTIVLPYFFTILLKASV